MQPEQDCVKEQRNARWNNDAFVRSRQCDWHPGIGGGEGEKGGGCAPGRPAARGNGLGGGGGRKGEEAGGVVWQLPP